MSLWSFSDLYQLHSWSKSGQPGVRLQGLGGRTGLAEESSIIPAPPSPVLPPAAFPCSKCPHLWNTPCHHLPQLQCCRQHRLLAVLAHELAWSALLRFYNSSAGLAAAAPALLMNRLIISITAGACRGVRSGEAEPELSNTARYYLWLHLARGILEVCGALGILHDVMTTLREGETHGSSCFSSGGRCSHTFLTQEVRGACRVR